MIVEERCYTLVPGGVAPWMELYEREAKEVQTSILGNLIGCFHTEIGTLNQVVLLWGYEDFNDRMRRREKLFQDPKWQGFIKKSAELLVKMESRLLIPAPFSPLQ